LISIIIFFINTGATSIFTSGGVTDLAVVQVEMCEVTTSFKS